MASLPNPPSSHRACEVTSAEEPSAPLDWTPSCKQDERVVGFLDLPRELRDLVYDFAFRVNGAILFYSSNPFAVQPIAKAMHARHKGNGPAEPQPLRDLIPVTLLRTCRQLRAESTSVLYGTNVFSFWVLKDTELLLTHRHLVRHIVTAGIAPSWQLQRRTHEVDSWWRRRLWPEIQQNGQLILDRFPHLETLTSPLKPPQHGSVWRPSLPDMEGESREQRIALAAIWVKSRCPFQDERLRECLTLEVVPPLGLSKEQFAGSRFAAEDERDENWRGCAEFVEAFELMKKMG